MITAAECLIEDEWNDTILDLGGHPLQMWGWGTVKSKHNWSVARVVFKDDETVVGAAQILSRALPWPFLRLNYAPRGPVYSQGNKEPVYDALAIYARKHLPGVVVSVEPDSVDGPEGSNWRLSQNTILISRTLILDLNKSEDELMSAMAKKTRQYIRKSSREGVVIRQVTTKAEIDECLGIYRQTAVRAHFALHDDQYYYDIQEKLNDSSVIFAAYEGEAIAAFVWLAVSGSTAFELYGGMNDRGQELRANYALKWHAIATCKRWGIARYDLNGLLNDGVSTFKMGFASHEDTLAGTFDYPLSPLYTVWTVLLPKVKSVMRRLKSLR